MTTPDLSLTEWIVLAVVGEAPAHGFAVARELEPSTDLGRILTVHRSLVYRALDRLHDAGLVERLATEPGDAAPKRTVMQVSGSGRRVLDRWFATPVDHVRDLRIEFLAKMRLTERLGRDPGALVVAQRRELAATLETLTAAGENDDVVDRWRRYVALATRDFLDSLD